MDLTIIKSFKNNNKHNHNTVYYNKIRVRSTGIPNATIHNDYHKHNSQNTPDTTTTSQSYYLQSNRRLKLVVWTQLGYQLVNVQHDKLQVKNIPSIHTQIEV